jgi:Asparagine synthase
VTHPLLDLDLVELVLSLDPETALDPKLNRPLLRAGVRGWAPDAILERGGKARFEPLFVELMTGADAATVTELLGDPDARIRRFTRPDLIDEMFVRGPGGHPGGPLRWTDEAFRLVATELWLRSVR